MGASWGSLGGLLGPLGGLLRPLGGLLRPLGGLLGASWGLLGASSGGSLDLSIRGPSRGPLLGPSWRSLGPSWAHLGPSWGPLGPSWGGLGGLLGRLGALLGGSWAVLERREAETARRLESFKNQWKIIDFGFLGRSQEVSWRPLGASWRPLGPSCAHVGRLGALFGRLGGLLGPPWEPLGAFLAVLEPSGLRKSHARNPGRAQERPGNLGSGPLRILKRQRSCVSLGALHFVPEARWRIRREPRL